LEDRLKMLSILDIFPMFTKLLIKWLLNAKLIKKKLVETKK